MGALEDLVASIGKRATRTKDGYQKYKPYFDRYHGGMPQGLMAAIAQGESDFRMDAPGDIGLGEVGIFQISASAEQRYGAPSGFRGTVEGNFALAGMYYNVEAKLLQLKFPAIFKNASMYDLWLASYLVFAIGRGGTHSVLKTSAPHAGDVVAQLVGWASAGGVQKNYPGGIGSQSPSKIAYRIQMLPVRWEIGKRSGVTMRGGQPVLVPTPPGMQGWTVPSEVRSHLRPPTILSSVGVLAVGVAAWWYLSRRKRRS